MTMMMAEKIKLNSRPSIPMFNIDVICCLLLLLLSLLSSTIQAQPMPQLQQPNSVMVMGSQQQQQQQPFTATEQQQQQSSAAAILASIVNSATQRQSATEAVQQQQQQQQPFIDGQSNNINLQQQQPNHHQTILNAAAQFGSSILGSPQQLNSLLNSTVPVNYREQGEILRQEILRRAGHLQKVVASSHEMIKNSGDLIVSRLLEQLNHRLNIAKSKADKIINEPTTNEVALRALGTINQGLNNVNNIIQNIVNQNKSKLNFQQISRQFSTALNAVQKQLNTQQQQQQQQQQMMQQSQSQ